MAKYAVNTRAVAHARTLIEARRYVLDSEWGEKQPRADDQNAYLKSHSWEEYAAWHLGLTEGAADETKARYAFVFGDFRRVHRSGLIACGVAAQGCRARRPPPPAAPRQGQRPDQLAPGRGRGLAGHPCLGPWGDAAARE
jgi:hypothetical protein